MGLCIPFRSDYEVVFVILIIYLGPNYKQLFEIYLK
jgi:hypothetical protein